MPAAADTRQLQLQISASSELLVRNLRQADNAIAQFQRSTDARLQTIDARFERLGRLREVAGGLGQSLTAALSVGSAATAGATYLRLADTAKQLHAQLVLATSQFGNLAKAQEDAERIAASTRIGLEASTALYTTFLRAAQPLGRTQADAALASETFAKALKLGGASAETASQATLQFSQALASGVLRGDEFNSIAEASPRVLRLLADAMGLPQGQLRALAAEGKLTADVLYDALTNTKVTAGLNKEFAQLPTTMGDAMTLVRDEAVKVAGAFDRGSQLSGAISSLILDGVNGFGSLADSAEASGVEIRTTFAALRDVFAPMLSGADGAFDAIGIRVASAQEQIGNLLRFVDRVRNAGPELQDFIEGGNAEFRRQTGYRSKSPDRSNLAGSFDRSVRRNSARARIDRGVAILEARGFIVPRRPDGTVDEAGIRRAPARPKPKPTPSASSGGGRTRGGSGGGRTRSPAADTFQLRTTDFDELYDSVQQKQAAERAARDASERFVAIFGEGDPLAAILDGHDSDLAARHASTIVEQLGPLAEYREQLVAATGDMNQALQGVAVNGFQALESSIFSVIDGTQSLSGAFRQMATSIVADLARIAIQKAIVSAIGKSFLGFSDGGPLKGVPGFANGGTPGGRISGPGTGTSDSILAVLGGGQGAIRVSNGEYIVNERATREYGPLIEAINQRRLPRFASGGGLGRAPVPSAGALAGFGGATSGGTIVVQVSLPEDLDARIDNRAAGVAVQVIREGMPQITRAATDHTIAELRKPRL